MEGRDRRPSVQHRTSGRRQHDAQHRDAEGAQRPLEGVEDRRRMTGLGRRDLGEGRRLVGEHDEGDRDAEEEGQRPDRPQAGGEVGLREQRGDDREPDEPSHHEPPRSHHG